MEPSAGTCSTKFILNLGKYVPKFDIAEFYSEEDVQDRLIRNKESTTRQTCIVLLSQEMNDSYDSVLLMRGHGFTVVSESVTELFAR